MSSIVSLVKVEAVNIYSSVYDTDQISVIRGSSLLLKKAIQYIKLEFKEKIDPVSTGASSGIFSIKECWRDRVDELVQEISGVLNDDKAYRCFTFVVTHSLHKNFQVAKEILVAKQRFMQLKSVSFAPDYISGSDNMLVRQEPCSAQGNRIGTQSDILPGSDNDSRISESIKIRFNHGKENRSRFYEEELREDYESLTANSEPDKKYKQISVEELNKLNFTCDIQSLGGACDYTKLNDKIAVLYLDGNRFSSIQREKVLSIDDQKMFDKRIQDYRKEFLSYILCCFNETSRDSLCFSNAKTEDGELRFETLLWGGDELIFVVPAWLGFDLLHAFYDFSNNWNYEGKNLTHAGGLVFCSTKTPISKIRNVANLLADEVKEKDFGREGNYFDYIVLESIDYPVESTMKSFFNNHYGVSSSARHALSAVDDWSYIKGELLHLMPVLPKGQIYKLANLFVNSNDADDEISKALIHLEKLMGSPSYDKLIKILGALFRIPGDIDSSKVNVNCRWIHLVELWDYLVPVLKDKKNEKM